MLTYDEAKKVFESGGTIVVNGVVVPTLKAYCEATGIKDLQSLPAEDVPQILTQPLEGCCICGGDGFIESWFNPENSRACMVCNESNKK